MASIDGENSNVNFVYHSVNEETLLLNNSPTRQLDADSTKVLLAKQKCVYSAITLADVFQRVVFTTIITSFLVFASSYLGYGHIHLLQAYFIFTIILWLTTTVINLFIECLMLRRHAILLGFLSYFLGVAILTGLYSNMSFFKISKYIILIPLYFICLGEGFCKSFIGEFGHYQFEDSRLSDKLKAYTNVIYWAGNVCAFLLILFLLGICEVGKYELGIGLCCVCIVAGMISFFLGWKHFREPMEKRINGIKLLRDIISNSRNVKCAAVNDENGSDVRSVHHWLDFAKLDNGGLYSHEEVEEAKSFLKVTAIFCSLIPYWVCNSQGYSTFLYQGFHLDTKIGDVMIPVSWTALCNIAAVLIFLKISEAYLYPALRRNGYSFPISWRVVTGMFLAFLSMCAAGGVQLFAHYAAFNYGTELHQIGTLNVTYATEVHILWTVPQYIFLGVSEVLVGLTTLTLGCKLCPKIFKKLITSMYYLMIAVGHMISLFVLSIGWFPSYKFLDGYEMIIYFSSLAVVSIIGILIYLCVIPERNSRGTTTVVNT